MEEGESSKHRGAITSAFDSRHRKILELERELSAVSKSKGPSDPAVRRLRTGIRDDYEALILDNHVMAELLEVAQALWRLHYKGIEEFRARIRKLMTSPPVFKHGKRKKRGRNGEPIVRVLTAFKAYLGEASGFFHGLVIKLRLKYGLSASSVDKRGAPQSCLISCHRLLIYLGDLARYKELYAVIDGQERDWSVASNHYLQAAYLWPSSGHPHNQLAVLGTYSGDELLALYRYCRSLAVQMPFVTARDNLCLLFEKARVSLVDFLLNPMDVESQDYIPLILLAFSQNQYLIPEVCSVLGLAGDLPTKSEQLNGSKSTTDQDAEMQWWKYFELHFVRLISIMFTKSSAEDFQDIFSKVENSMQRLLVVGLEKALLRQSQNAPVCLQITAILIYCLHHLTCLDRNSEPFSWEIPGLFWTMLLRFSVTIFCFMLQKSSEKASNSFRACAVIFIEWLTMNMDSLLKSINEASAILVCFGQTLAPCVSALSRTQKSTLKKTGETGKAFNALQEDTELLGFMPLASMHARLCFPERDEGRGGPTLESDESEARFLAASEGFLIQLNSGLLSLGEKELTFQPMVEFQSDEPSQSTEQLDTSAEESSWAAHTTPSLNDWIKGSVPLRSSPVNNLQSVMECNDPLALPKKVINLDSKYLEKSSNVLHYLAWDAIMDAGRPQIRQCATKDSGSLGLDSLQKSIDIAPRTVKLSCNPLVEADPCQNVCLSTSPVCHRLCMQRNKCIFAESKVMEDKESFGLRLLSDMSPFNNERLDDCMPPSCWLGRKVPWNQKYYKTQNPFVRWMENSLHANLSG